MLNFSKLICLNIYKQIFIFIIFSLFFIVTPFNMIFNLLNQSFKFLDVLIYFLTIH